MGQKLKRAMVSTDFQERRSVRRVVEDLVPSRCRRGYPAHASASPAVLFMHFIPTRVSTLSAMRQEKQEVTKLLAEPVREESCWFQIQRDFKT